MTRSATRGVAVAAGTILRYCLPCSVANCATTTEGTRMTTPACTPSHGEAIDLIRLQFATDGHQIYSLTLYPDAELVEVIVVSGITRQSAFEALTALGASEVSTVHQAMTANIPGLGLSVSVVAVKAPQW